MKCSICFNDINIIKTIQCHHKFCYECITKWYEKSNKCPICRYEFDLSNNHKYNTRFNYFHKNQKDIINHIKNIMIEFEELDYQGRVHKFDELLKFLYLNKNLFQNQNFKNVTIDKIQYLKKHHENIGFYWDQKIYNKY